MNEVKLTRSVVVESPQGLHARPADLFVKLACRYQSNIEVVKEGRRVSGKSILDILTLGAAQGCQLDIEATGADAAEALDAIEELFRQRFYEQDGAAEL